MQASRDATCGVDQSEERDMLKVQMDLGSFGGRAELAARHDGGMASAEVQWLAVTGLRGQGLGA
jgi:hypothetical protein